MENNPSSSNEVKHCRHRKNSREHCSFFSAHQNCRRCMCLSSSLLLISKRNIAKIVGNSCTMITVASCGWSELDQRRCVCIHGVLRRTLDVQRGDDDPSAYFKPEGLCLLPDWRRWPMTLGMRECSAREGVWCSARLASAE